MGARMDIVNTFKYEQWSILIPGRGIHLTLTFYSALGFMVFSIITHFNTRYRANHSSKVGENWQNWRKTT